MTAWSDCIMGTFTTRSSTFGRRLRVSLVVLVMILFTTSVACNTVSGVAGGGQCHDAQTGEVLKTIKDADGNAFKVMKVDSALAERLGALVDFCGVSLDAQVYSEGTLNIAPLRTDYLYHLDGVTPIEVEGNFKGLLVLNPTEYQWY